MPAIPAKAAMTVPLLDLRAQYATIRKDVDEAVRRVMESQRFIGGPEVSGLEEEVARLGRAGQAVTRAGVRSPASAVSSRNAATTTSSSALSTEQLV